MGSPCRTRKKSAAARRIIFDPPLQPAERLGKQERKGEKDEQRSPKMLHQKPRSVELEERAEPDDGHQELPDDDALDGADHAETDARQNFRQRRPDINLGE